MSKDFKCLQLDLATQGIALAVADLHKNYLLMLIWWLFSLFGIIFMAFFIDNTMKNAKRVLS